MFAWLRRLTPFDRKLAVILILLVLLTFLLPLRQGAGTKIVVSASGKTVFVASLDQDQQVELPGPLGTTVLKITSGAARVLSSPCPQKICLGLGEIRQVDDLIACVPNRLVMTIEGSGDGRERNYDFLSR